MSLFFQSPGDMSIAVAEATIPDSGCLIPDADEGEFIHAVSSILARMGRSGFFKRKTVRDAF
jgi:hypothetical protein